MEELPGKVLFGIAHILGDTPVRMDHNKDEEDIRA